MRKTLSQRPDGARMCEVGSQEGEAYRLVAQPEGGGYSLPIVRW